MPKSHLIEKYKKLVEQEEKRIEQETMKRFARLRNVDTHPSKIIGKTYQKHKYDKQSYNYLRQRYYRLKRIKKADIVQATMSYSFDSWYSVIEEFIAFYGVGSSNTVRDIRNEVQSMTVNQKNKFVDIGYNYSLRAEYMDMGKDIRNKQETTLQHILFRVKQVKKMTR